MTREPQEQGSAGAGGSVGEMADETRGALRETQEKLRDRTREKADEVRERARQKSGEIRNEAEQKADRWTTTLGEQVERVARALRAAGDALEDEGEGRMSAMSTGAAETVERMAGYLRDEKPTEMVRDFEQMARKNPTAFVATTFAAGLLVGRFFRSGEPSSGRGAQDRTDSMYDQDEMGTGAAGGGAYGATPDADRSMPYTRTVHEPRRPSGDGDWEGGL